jgi:hypothetical protein
MGFVFRDIFLIVRYIQINVQLSGLIHRGGDRRERIEQIIDVELELEANLDNLLEYVL